MKNYGVLKRCSKGLLISSIMGVLLVLVLSNLPAQAQSGTYSNNDVTVLAKMIHGEARGESYIGKVAVGAVILNRVEDKKFPGSVYGVCMACAFSRVLLMQCVMGNIIWNQTKNLSTLPKLL